jgi:hypothetical protein
MKINSLVIVSDLHCGCQFGLCPDAQVHFDGGGSYSPSPIQRKVWRLWGEFWNDWVPTVTRGEPYAVVINGDALEGIHHGATTQISHNLADQRRLAEEVLRPIVGNAAAYYHIRGTEAHVGASACEEETLARNLGAIPDSDGNFSRYELWVEIGDRLVHLMHHIGTTGSQAYESTAVHKELTESYTEAARWGSRPPDFIVRSHRHRFFATSIEAQGGRASSIVTPGWQAKTPFVWRIASGRLSMPQFGGIIIRAGEEEVYYRERVWSIDRAKPETLEGTDEHQ